MATGVTLVTADGKGPVTASNPIGFSPAGTTAVNTTSINSSVGQTAVTTNLNAPSYNFIIENTHASQVLYFSLNGTAATTSNYGIVKGTSKQFSLAYPISSISFIASGSSSTFNLLAY